MKTVFITGADRGVGFALCEQFLDRGYLVIAGQYMPEWPALEQLKQKYLQQLYIVPLDVRSTDSVVRAAELTREYTDRIDILINCAGIYGDDQEEKFKDIINVNTMGPLRVIRAFLPLMENGMRRLCFFSSESGSSATQHRGDDGGSAYCMSKSMLNMEVKLLFNELRPKGYTFRLYHPGWVRSYMSGVKATVGKLEPEESAQVAVRQFTEDRACEDILMVVDVYDAVWAF